MFADLSVNTAFSRFATLVVALALAMPMCAADDDEHEHAEKGPHGGPLIELGDEEYHAELMLDEKAGVVTIYLLDGKAEKSVAIEAKDVLINLKHGKKPEQFRLKAGPIKGDPEGKSSRFSLKNAELIEDLHHEETSAQLRVNISGKAYSGKIDLKHDEDHDHKDEKK